MADELSTSREFWNVLEEATQTVESWETWKQRYEADIYYEGYGRQTTSAATETDRKRE